MKYLLSWVANHLDIESWNDIDTIENIIQKIETHITEVAEYQEISLQKNNFKIGTLIDETDDFCLIQDSDNKILSVPPRPHAVTGSLYVLIEEEKKYRFASMKDFYAETKHNLIPPIHGSIEKNIEIIKEIKKKIDFLIKIDSTSIGNRPDLFSHRGLARELSAIYNIRLKEEKEITIKKENIKSKNLFAIQTKNITGYTAFSSLCSEKETFLEYVPFLCAMDTTPHSYLIDLTNFVLFDCGQPLHVFDKQKIKGQLIFQHNTQSKMDCLDNTTIEIDKEDTVITNQKNAVSLVGIIGGLHTAVSLKTKEIIVESASTVKENIIKSVKKHQKKTESAIRSQKQTFYQGTLLAIHRYLYLLEKDTINFQLESIESENKEEAKKKIILSQEYISKVIGQAISLDFIISLLKKLEYTVYEEKNLTISVMAPWFRADITHKDEIIEDITRHLGYDTITLAPVSLAVKNYSQNSNFLELKKTIVLLTGAHEVITYGIQDEENADAYLFNSYVKTIPLANSYSEKQKNLISTALINHLTILAKKIKENASDLAIFEINPIWRQNEELEEHVFLTICFYKKSATYNFYEYLLKIKKIMAAFGYPILLKPIEDEREKNHNLYSAISATILYQNEKIGTAGFIDPTKIYRETKKTGEFFGIEINLGQLLRYAKGTFLNTDYPSFDISFLLKKTEKINSIMTQIKIAFGQIIDIECIDWFENKEWLTTRSATLRIYSMNEEKKELEKNIKEYLEKRSFIIR